MAKKVIGYQITNLNQDIPYGLYSFQLFKTAEDAFRYLRENKLNKGLLASQCWFVKEYYEGDIEDPTYIRNNSVKKYQVTLYYHTNVTIEVFAKDEQEAKTNAYIESAYHTQELIDGLEEDSSPDVCEVDFL
jgi:hypothetical protein